MSKCQTCGTTLIDKRILPMQDAPYTRAICPACNEDIDRKIDEGNERVLAIKLRDAGLPIRYISTHLSESDFKFKGIDDVIDHTKGIYYIGESGIGKTHRLAAWIREYLLDGKTCKYVDFSSFAFDYSSRRDFAEYTEYKDACLASDAIFIDDFEPNPYTYDLAYNFINALFSQEKVVFFASIHLPAQDKLAMRVGQMTYQIELVRRGR